MFLGLIFQWLSFIDLIQSLIFFFISFKTKGKVSIKRLHGHKSEEGLVFVK